MATREIHTDFDFKTVSKIINLPNGVNAGDAATMGQLNAAIQGLNWKDNVRAASTANITISGPGATIDGVSMVSGDRFLAKDQSTGSENGIYVWNGAAVAATRATDADTGAKIESAVVTVDEGTANADSSWRCNTDAITIGSTAIVWGAFGGSVPDASTSTKGKIQLATQSEVNTGTDANKAVTPSTLAGATALVRHASGTLGDGAASTFTLTHNFNRKDVLVAVYRNSGNFDEIATEIRRNNVNSVDVLFTDIPTSNQYAWVVLG